MMSWQAPITTCHAVPGSALLLMLHVQPCDRFVWLSFLILRNSPLVLRNPNTHRGRKVTVVSAGKGCGSENTQLEFFYKLKAVAVLGQDLKLV